VILAYHRVAEPGRDPQLMSVSPVHFSEHLEVIRRSWAPARLNELEDPKSPGREMHGAVIVTFDDGYVDTFTEAKPRLEDVEIPATVFVTSGYVGARREFWWDAVERVAFTRDVGELGATVGGERRVWKLGPNDVTANEGWNVRRKEPLTTRQRVYLEVVEMLKPLSAGEQIEALDELSAGIDEEGIEERLCVTRDQLCGLADSEWIEIGGHTVSHAQLSALDGPAQLSEIRDGRLELQQVIGRPVSSFAYPYGGRSDIGEKTPGLVEEAGFRLACTISSRAVTPRSDRFHLPRLIVRDWDGDEFEKHLEAVFAP